jgi:glycosyltransferase involved in cell wall biosynthesis
MTEMKLFFDGRWTRTDYHDGISRYTSGLLEGFQAAGIPVTVLIHDIRQLKLLPKDITYELINNPLSIKELFVARKLNKLGAEVVFSPLQVMGFWGRKYKLILTLQDIIYYRHPKPPTGLSPLIRLVWRLFHLAKWPQRALLNRADHVATVSQTSKKFIEEYGLTDRQVSVVYNAPSSTIPLLKQSKPTNNILYMGSFMPYKNVEVLIRGMEHLPNSFTLHLLSKVSPQRRAELERLIPSGANVIFHNGTPEEEYAQLLSSAYCLATGSKEEGFGLPIVEAQIQGTPVICSDLEIFHEVAGKGALFFDPDSPEEFAQRVRELESRTAREKQIEAGRRQAAKFSWEKSAREIVRISNDLMHDRGK